MLSLIHSNVLCIVHKTDWLLIPGIIILALVVYCVIRSSNHISKETLRAARWLLIIQVVLFVAYLIYELTR